MKNPGYSEDDPADDDTIGTREYIAEEANKVGTASRRRGAPRLSAKSSRETLIKWLKWNDPNGAYDDGDHDNDLTEGEAWGLVFNAAVGDGVSNPGKPLRVTSIHGGSAALRAAIKKYLTFHQLEPKQVKQISAVIPVRLAFVGEATTTYYKSDKWTGKQQSYYHEHSAGVRLCVPENTVKGGHARITPVPSWIRGAKAICELGESLGVEFNTPDGEGALKVSPPRPRLCTIPSGKALLILNPSLTKVEAIMWGGALDVLDVGIVH